MHRRPEPSAGPTFLAGGGETGAFMRAHDWSVTPLGSPEAWPQSLRSALSTCLNSRAVSAIYWGPEFRLLYNDAYRQFLDTRHPWALGRPMSEIWPTMWQALTTSARQVYETGEGVVAQDQMLLMERDGGLAETFWYYSFAPIRGETGRVDGIFLTALDTTGRVLAERRLVTERERLSRMFEQAPGFMAMLRGPEHVFELVNQAYLQLVGHRDVVGKPAREALPEVEGQGFFELLDGVYASGRAFRGDSLKVDLQRRPGAPVEERFIDLVYQPVTDAEGRVTGLFVEGSDVTKRMKAEAALRESERRLHLIVEGAKDHAFLTTDPEGTITSWSVGAEDIFGWPAAEAVGRSVSIIFTPEDRAAGADRQEIATAAREGGADGERWHLRKNGSRVFISGSVHPLHDALSRELGFLRIAREETARRAAHEAAARLVALVSSTPDAVVSFAAEDGNITSWNKGAERLFGYSVAEAVGAPTSLLIPASDQLTVLEDQTGVFNQVLEVGSTQIESVRQRKDGTLVDVSISAARMEGADGRVLGVSAIFRDITARKQAEAALRELNETLERRVVERTAELSESHRRFQGIFDSALQFMALLTPNGTVVEVNHTALAWSGIAPADIVGKSFWLAAPMRGNPALQAAVESGIRRAAAGETVRAEHEMRGAGEVRATVDFSLKPVLGEAGEPIWLVAEGRDITELKAAQEALRQSQKLESMGQLTGGVAHDVNNLLTPIMGSLDLLQRRGLGGEREQRLIAGALQSAERVRVLVQRLLAFARRQPLQPKPVDLGALIAGMADLVASTSGPQTKVAVDVADDLPAAVADPNQLEMAILNLSVNARDAMPDGGRLTIAAHAEDVAGKHRSGLAAGRYVRLSVADTGGGMDEATLKRAIEPFFSTKGVGKGTGLGLSMVHGLAAQLGGALSIASKPGLGTTVELWLPTTEELVEGPARAEETEARAVAGTAFLVDDEELVRASTADMLADLGYAVVEAGSAEEALRLIDGGLTPEVVVTDHLMPGLNGTEFAREMRRRLPSVRALVISGYAEVESVAPDLPRLVKPFRQADLAAKLAGLLTDQ